jgi:hypothetical protein
MKRPLLRLVITLLAILLLSPCGTYAAQKPVVVSHDETYASRTIRFRVAWQSENPVVMVKIFAGKEQKEIKVDEYDNRRTRDGYSGEVSAVVELDPAFAEESLAYVIQLEDDARLKSDLLSGKIQIVKAKKDDDQWGQDKLTSPSTQTTTGTTTGGTGVEILDRVAGVMDRFDQPPVLGNLIIKRVGTDGVTISTRASDDKAISGVTFKIFDSTGNLVEQDSLTATGKSWEGTSKTFNLMNGNYKAVVQATDGTGNTSREKTQFFAITGSTLTTQPSSMGITTSDPYVTQPSYSEPAVVQTPEMQTPVVQTPDAQIPAVQTPATLPTQ